MALDFDNYKDDCTKNIWAKICEIVTYIQYSSLFAEKKRNSEHRWIAIGFGVILLIPALKGIAVSCELLSNRGAVSIGIDVIYIIAAGFAAFKYPEFILRYIGYYEKDISGLLDLNRRLEIFKDKLFCIYAKAESCTTNKTLEKVYEEYDKICLEHNNDITEHDKLTGKIDHEIEVEAQNKAQIILNQIINL
nr:hypothetical protein [uncultured Prevotella sp.]